MISPPPSLPLEDIQGNILRGYRMPTVRHFVLGIQTRDAAKKVLQTLVSAGEPGSLRITTAAPWATKPDYCLNIAFTFDGIKALGLPDVTLASFPDEFRAGAAAQAASIGDTGPDAPEHWVQGLQATSDAPASVHILLSLYATNKATLERHSAALRQMFSVESALVEHSCQDGEALPNSRVHFGYVDGISQPHIAGAEPPKCACPHDESLTGDFLLGYPRYYSPIAMPQPESFSRNGTYCAYRILSQDVVGFEAYLDKAAASTNLDKELIAAKMCGRWRNGVPLSLSPDAEQPPVRLTHAEMNAFDYRPTVQYPDAYNDFQGFRCPYGSHIRRANPRTDDIQGHFHPTALVNGKNLPTESGQPRRIVRRGIPYGPLYDPHSKRPAAEEAQVERGLLLLVLCADLHEQFELIMSEWINNGSFTAVPLQPDALLGNVPDGNGQFSFPVPGQKPVKLQGFPRFVGTRGGAYGFIPSISGIRHLAQAAY
jgi:Dyp-type peroxidase family